MALASWAVANTCYADNSERVDDLVALLVSSAGSHNEFPRELRARVEIRKDAIRTLSSGEMIFPARVSFEGITNSYCRLAVVDSSGNSAQLVAVSSYLDSDQCKSVRLIAFTDLNSDHANDAVMAVRQPSNHYDVDVEELRVYLSREGSTTQFCLAEDLANLPTNGKVVDSIKAEIRRQGNAVLKCAD